MWPGGLVISSQCVQCLDLCVGGFKPQVWQNNVSELLTTSEAAWFIILVNSVYTSMYVCQTITF